MTKTVYTFVDTARDDRKFYVEATCTPEAVLFVKKYMPAHFPTSTLEGGNTLLPKWLEEREAELEE